MANVFHHRRQLGAVLDEAGVQLSAFPVERIGVRRQSSTLEPTPGEASASRTCFSSICRSCRCPSRSWWRLRILHERQRRGHARVACDFQRVAEFLGRDAHVVKAFGRVHRAGMLERGRHALCAAHQPRREHATPLRFELVLGLRAVCLSSLCPLPSSLLCQPPHPFELPKQLLQVADRRVVCRSRRAAPAAATPPRAAPFPVPGLTPHRSSTSVFQKVELDIELADGTEDARERAHFLVELLDLGRRRPLPRRSAAPRECGATRRASCAARRTAADEIRPDGAELVQPFTPEPVTGS